MKPSRSVYQNPLMDRGVDVPAGQTYKIKAVAISDDNGFLSAAYKDLSVTTAKLAALAVTAAKLASNAVETAKINALAVTTAKLAASAVTEPKVVNSAGVGGLFVRKTALALYDFSVDGGTEGTITLASTATLPDNAVVTDVTINVITTCTSSGDAATIAVQLPTDGLLTTAVAISDAADPWDAGVKVGTTVTLKMTTGARAIELLTAGGQDLTAGKFEIAVGYYVSV